MRAQTLRQVAVAVRSSRIAARLTQAQLAERAGVSRWWVSQFEAGRARAEVGLLLRVLDALDLCLEITPRSSSTLDGGEAATHLDALLSRHGRD